MMLRCCVAPLRLARGAIFLEARCAAAITFAAANRWPPRATAARATSSSTGAAAAAAAAAAPASSAPSATAATATAPSADSAASAAGSRAGIGGGSGGRGVRGDLQQQQLGCTPARSRFQHPAPPPRSPRPPCSPSPGLRWRCSLRRVAACSTTLTRFASRRRRRVRRHLPRQQQRHLRRAAARAAALTPPPLPFLRSPASAGARRDVRPAGAGRPLVARGRRRAARL